MNVRDENFICIQGWMRTKLGLKGNDLLVYAIIYGFNQTENQKCTCSIQYLADWCGATKQGILNNIKSLTEKGLITKSESYSSGVKIVEYRSTQFTEPVNSVDQGGKLSLLNNIVNKKIDNIESLSKDKDKTQKFQFGKKKEVKPTLYSKCICLIDDFTDNESLRKSLTTFLNICLENAKESGTPFYANHFKGKLNSLRALTDDHGYLNDQLAIKIVKQSLDNGWCGFYQIRADKSKRNAARDIEHLNPEKMSHATKEQKKKFKEDIASGRAEEF